jgi:hypothetical protein
MAGMSLSLMVSLVTVVVIRHQVPSAGMQCCLSNKPFGAFFYSERFYSGIELIVFGSAGNVEENFVGGAGLVAAIPLSSVRSFHLPFLGSYYNSPGQEPYESKGSRTVP